MFYRIRDKLLTDTGLVKEDGSAWKKGILIPFHEQFPGAFKKGDGRMSGFGEPTVPAATDLVAASLASCGHCRSALC